MAENTAATMRSALALVTGVSAATWETRSFLFIFIFPPELQSDGAKLPELRLSVPSPSTSRNRCRAQRRCVRARLSRPRPRLCTGGSSGGERHRAARVGRVSPLSRKAPENVARQRARHVQEAA